MKRLVRDWIIRLAVAVWVLDFPLGMVYGWKTLLWIDLVVLLVFVGAVEWDTSTWLFNERQRMSNGPRSLLAECLQDQARQGYDALVQQINLRKVVTVTSIAGKQYQIEVRVVWDGKPGGVLRILGTIDSGGWRALIPMTDSVLVSSD
jgi:hypothetical protein